MNKVGKLADFSEIFQKKLPFTYSYDKEKQVLKLSAENMGKLFEVLARDEELLMDYLRDLTAKDEPPGSFSVVYNFLSFTHRHTLMVIADIPTPKDGTLPEIESATCFWNSANWLEREVYDMFGIRFKNHPDLRRIFLDETVNFYPLRKSFHVDKVVNVADLNEIEEAYRKMAEEQKKLEEMQRRAKEVQKPVASQNQGGTGN